MGVISGGKIFFLGVKLEGESNLLGVETDADAGITVSKLFGLDGEWDGELLLESISSWFEAIFLNQRVDTNLLESVTDQFSSNKRMNEFLWKYSAIF